MEIIDNVNDIKKLFPEILKRHMGIVTPACKAANISRTTYYNWKNADSEFAKECDEAIEERIDFAESKLLKCIEEEDTTAIIFFLKTQGKSRGYVERFEHAGKDGEAIKHNIELKTPEIADALQKVIDSVVRG